MSTYPLPILDNKLSNLIKKGNFDSIYSKNRAQPKLSYGFNYYVYQTKDKTSILKGPEFKNKFYLVTNPYETSIKDYDKDINKCSELYFKLQENGIISRAFYKLWEILLTFNLISDKSSISSAHLAEAPGAFVQATCFYRDRFNSKLKPKDVYNCISIKGNNTIPFKKEKLDKCMSNIKIFDGDLTDLSVQKTFESKVNNVDFITADGGFEWKDENKQEQEAFRLILAEIITALRIQKNGGSFVLKIFETFTDVTIKFLMILSTYYGNVIIHKPLTSRASNSERYVICTKFKGISDTELKNLEKLLVDINSNELKNNFLQDFWLDLEIPDDYKLVVITSAMDIMNKQFVAINEMMNYIQLNNRYGDAFHKYLAAQKQASEKWTTVYLPLDNDMLKSSKNIIEKNMKEQVIQVTDNVNDLKARLTSALIIT